MAVLDRSSLLDKLSAELRNSIYHQVLVEEAPITINYDVNDVDALFRRPFPALLRTCRRVRLEASQLYYHANTFVVKQFPSRYTRCSPMLIQWLQMLGSDNRRSLRRVRYLSDWSRNGASLAKRLQTCYSILADHGCAVEPAVLYCRMVVRRTDHSDRMNEALVWTNRPDPDPSDAEVVWSRTPYFVGCEKPVIVFGDETETEDDTEDDYSHGYGTETEDESEDETETETEDETEDEAGTVDETEIEDLVKVRIDQGTYSMLVATARALIHETIQPRALDRNAATREHNMVPESHDLVEAFLQLVYPAIQSSSDVLPLVCFFGFRSNSILSLNSSPLADPTPARGASGSSRKPSCKDTATVDSAPAVPAAPASLPSSLRPMMTEPATSIAAPSHQSPVCYE